MGLHLQLASYPCHCCTAQQVSRSSRAASSSIATSHVASTSKHTTSASAEGQKQGGLSNLLDVSDLQDMLADDEVCVGGTVVPFHAPATRRPLPA